MIKEIKLNNSKEINLNFLDLRKTLFNNCKQDKIGNFYKKVGESSKVMFTTRVKVPIYNLENLKFSNTVENSDNKIRQSFGVYSNIDSEINKILILVSMMNRNVPGIYYFFNEQSDIKMDQNLSIDIFENMIISEDIKKIISIENFNGNFINTQSLSKKSCSDEFANNLLEQLNSNIESTKFKIENSNLNLESHKFTHIVPECVRLSMDLKKSNSLEKLFYMMSKVNWDSLPVKRNISNFNWGDDWNDDSRISNLEFIMNWESELFSTWEA